MYENQKSFQQGKITLYTQDALRIRYNTLGYSTGISHVTSSFFKKISNFLFNVVLLLLRVPLFSTDNVGLNLRMNCQQTSGRPMTGFEIHIRSDLVIPARITAVPIDL